MVLPRKSRLLVPCLVLASVGCSASAQPNPDSSGVASPTSAVGGAPSTGSTATSNSTGSGDCTFNVMTGSRPPISDRGGRGIVHRSLGSEQRSDRLFVEQCCRWRAQPRRYRARRSLEHEPSNTAARPQAIQHLHLPYRGHIIDWCCVHEPGLCTVHRYPIRRADHYADGHEHISSSRGVHCHLSWPSWW